MKLLLKLRHSMQKSRVIRSNVKTGTNFTFGSRTTLWAPAGLKIGNNVSLGSDVRIETDGTIGDGVLIANSVGIVGRNDHIMSEVGVTIQASKWVGNDVENMSRPVIIGSDVWIGFGAVVLSGVVIGDSAVVGAGSVVVNDIPANSIAVGNPARVVGQRFEPDLLREHWNALATAGVHLSTPRSTDNAG